MFLLYFKIKYWLSRAFLYFFVLKRNGIGAEIGVNKGKNAKLLYYITRPFLLVLVDCYDGSNRPLEKDKILCEKISRWADGKRVMLFIEKSKNASEEWGYVSTKLDWIYIDADHYDLYNDLVYWYDNVKSGGVLMGDDYCYTWKEVIDALNKFCKERNIKYKKLNVQWYFRKP